MGKDSSIRLTPGRARISGGRREGPAAGIWYACYLGASFSLMFWLTTMMELPAETGGVLLLTAGLAVWYMLVFLSGKTMKILIPVSAVLAAGFLFWQRDMVRRGLVTIVNLYSRYIQDHYAQNPGYLELEEGPVTLFPALLAISAVFLFFLGYSMLRKRKAGTLFFLMAVLLCAGLTVNRFPHPLPVFGGIAVCLAVRAMNGPGGEAGQRMQARAGLLSLLTAGVVAAVSYFGLGPLLSEQILPLHPQVQEFQRQLEADFSETMERVTSGRWSFTGSWSGMVESGTLSNTAARRDDEEVLRLTVSRRPEETIYLKGFIGGLYQGSYWQEISDEDFQASVEEWQLPEHATAETYRELLYQSPYRWRDMYGNPPGYFRLEFADAAGDYGYLPYFSMVTGERQPVLTADVETLRDGAEFFEGSFFQESVPAAMYAQYLASVYPAAGSGGTGMESYREYVREQYLYVPVEGLDRLKEYMSLLLQSFSDENGFYPSLQQVTDMIRETLSHYSYSLNLDSLPPGEDFVEYFLFEQDRGFCTHFASTTVLMYRLAGYPARYVTGYAAHASDFQEDENGMYTVSVTGADAHAWAEVYVDGLGWIPVEMTPGYSGSGEEGQSRPTVTPYEDGQTTPEPSETPEPETSSEEETGGTEGPSGIIVSARIPAALRALLWAAAAAGVLLLAVFLRRAWICGRRSRRFRKRSPDGTVRSVLYETEQLLRDGGIRIPDDIADERYAEEVQKRFSSLEENEMLRFVRIGEQASFSPSPVSGEDAAWCVRLYRKLEKELAGEQKGLRKLWWRFIKCR